MRDENVTVLKKIALPISLAYVVALVYVVRRAGMLCPLLNGVFEKPKRRRAIGQLRWCVLLLI